MRKEISWLLRPAPPALGIAVPSWAKNLEKSISEQASPEEKIFYVLRALSDPWSH